MNREPTTRQFDNQYLIYRSLEPVSVQWFDAIYWQSHGTVERIGTGRGAAWYIHTQGDDYVLRHYQRGGLVAHLLQDRYIWHGLASTRAWREWQLLADSYDRGLPVPQPIAARVVRCGVFYTADILIRRITDSVALSTVLQYRELDAVIWQAIGRCIRRFHDQHINHADLNAHNILLNTGEQIFLVDFDKGRVDHGETWKEKNLQRLHRSLNKLSREYEDFYFKASDWEVLLAGYLR